MKTSFKEFLQKIKFDDPSEFDFDAETLIDPNIKDRGLRSCLCPRGNGALVCCPGRCGAGPTPLGDCARGPHHRYRGPETCRSRLGW